MTQANSFTQTVSRFLAFLLTWSFVTQAGATTTAAPATPAGAAGHPQSEAEELYQSWMQEMHNLERRAVPLGEKLRRPDLTPEERAAGVEEARRIMGQFERLKWRINMYVLALSLQGRSPPVFRPK